MLGGACSSAQKYAAAEYIKIWYLDECLKAKALRKEDDLEVISEERIFYRLL